MGVYAHILYFLAYSRGVSQLEPCSMPATPVFVTLFTGSGNKCELGEDDQQFETHAYLPAECDVIWPGSNLYYSLHVKAGAITNLKLNCNSACQNCDNEYIAPPLNKCLDGVRMDILSKGKTTRCVGPSDLANNPGPGFTVFKYSETTDCASTAVHITGVSTTRLNSCLPMIHRGNISYFELHDVNTSGVTTLQYECDSICADCRYTVLIAKPGDCVAMSNHSFQAIRNSQVQSYLEREGKKEEGVGTGRSRREVRKGCFSLSLDQQCCARRMCPVFSDLIVVWDVL